MPNLTENYGLKKPLSEEFYDVNIQNENMDIIDEALGKCASIPVTNEVPEDSEIWIDPDDLSVEEGHVFDKNNPHGVTPEQIGAAPWDYGLAEHINGTDGGRDLNNCRSHNHYYKIGLASGIANLPPVTDLNSLNNALVYNYGQADSALTQVYYAPHARIVCVRHYIDWNTPKWGEWEFANPPMNLGVEYRTTERWNGKAVWTALLDYGALPVSARRKFTHNLSMTNVLRCTATRTGADVGESIPSHFDGQKIDVFASTSGIHITTNFDASASGAIVQLWYTKD